MALQEELLELEKGFWLGGEDHFLAHLDDKSMLVFAQMRGLYARAEVAASARNPERWSDLRVADVSLHRPIAEAAFLSYEARVKRSTGDPYRALIGSGYVRRGGEWKLAFHQHSELQPERAA
jgi:hypothetical protein